ncbi:hypothetical protein RHMOL_Rhmol10G0156300 [Rhododendron molle]|uniref:Uncharacterized protein n=1 Tax=Rhododendron molle TaxID=49168 RepID=A0ACC0M4E2_RHOML|nr:hypothetical protein RHMOL_Rhmol10G0156300 [Rhododendron molle]
MYKTTMTIDLPIGVPSQEEKRTMNEEEVLSMNEEEGSMNEEEDTEIESEEMEEEVVSKANPIFEPPPAGYDDIDVIDDGLGDDIVLDFFFANGGDAIAEFLLVLLNGVAECFCCFSVRMGCYYCLGIMNHFPVLLLLSCVVLSYAGL